MNRKVYREEIALAKLADAAGMPQATQIAMQNALDIFPDIARENVGWPTSRSTKSTTRLIQIEANIAPDSTLTAAGLPYEMAVVFSPFVSGTGSPLSGGQIATTLTGSTNAGYNTISGGSGPTKNLYPGFTVFQGPLGMDWMNPAGTNPTSVSGALSFPQVYTQDEFCWTAVGAEITYTGPKMVQGGDVTIARLPSRVHKMTAVVPTTEHAFDEVLKIHEERCKEKVHSGPKYNESALYKQVEAEKARREIQEQLAKGKEKSRSSGEYDRVGTNLTEYVPLDYMIVPPSTVALLSNCPGAIDRPAEDGVYANMVVNDPLNPPVMATSQDIAFGDTINYSTVTDNSYKCWYPNSYVNKINAIMPYDPWVAHFSNLQITTGEGDASFKIIVRYSVETFPTNDQTLLPFVRPPTPWHPLFPMIIGQAMARLPPGVAVGENPFGEWLGKALGYVETAAPFAGAVAGAVLGNPVAGYQIGARVGEAAGAVSRMMTPRPQTVRPVQIMPAPSQLETIVTARQANRVRRRRAVREIYALEEQAPPRKKKSKKKKGKKNKNKNGKYKPRRPNTRVKIEEVD